MAGLGRRSAMLAALALIPAGAAMANQSAPVAPAPAAAASPAGTLSGVTVTAPAKPNPLVDPTTQFVRQHLPESQFSEKFPRFHDDICVKVLGLPPEFGAFVAKRVVEIAAQVHAPIAKTADCVPNVHVVFSPQPQALLTDIAKRKDILLGFYWNARDLKHMATFKGPISAWYVTATVDQFGETRLEIHDPTAWQNPRAGRAGSRLSNGIGARLEHSLILADANKVAGEKIDAVADYIAVLALARWQGLERCNAIPTILNLMAEGCDTDAVPDAATPADLALLTGLYSVGDLESGSQQRATIASAMRAADATRDKARR